MMEGTVQAIHVIIGFASLVLVGLGQTVAIAIWAGRVSETLEHLKEKWREEIPRLRAAKHDHANVLQEHIARFGQMDDRFEALHRQMGRFDAVNERLGRGDQKFEDLVARVRSIETKLDM